VKIFQLLFGCLFVMKLRVDFQLLFAVPVCVMKLRVDFRLLFGVPVCVMKLRVDSDSSLGCLFV